MIFMLSFYLFALFNENRDSIHLITRPAAGLNYCCLKRGK